MPTFPPWIPSVLREPVRRTYHRWKRKRLEKLPPLSRQELHAFLTKTLNLGSGQTLFVHSSLSELRTDATAEDVAKLLIDIVGPTGNVLMPFYPMKSSHEWLIDGKPFDLRKHRTSMGALATAFAKHPDVRKSIHPTKSVAVYGNDRDVLISEHSQSPMPYGAKSPYAKVAELPGSSIIGLGVSSDYLSCMHVAVDADADYPIQPYVPKAYVGVVIDHKGQEHNVTSYAHDGDVTSKEDVPRFLNETRCPTYREVGYKERLFFTVDAKSLINHVGQQGRLGKTFFYPRSMNHQQPKRIPVS